MFVEIRKATLDACHRLNIPLEKTEQLKSIPRVREEVFSWNR